MFGARAFIAIAALLIISACTGPAEPKWASDADVARARYVHDGPPMLTLYTVIGNGTGFGAHASLMINADKRLIFDPAGTWHHPQLPERNDVHFGMSDPVVDFYVDYHTRVTFHTVIQTLEVTPEVAAAAKAQALAHGAVPKAQCAISIGNILRNVPGFEDAPSQYFPKRLMAYFGAKPRVETRIFRDFDSDDNSGVIQAPPAIHLAQNS